MQRIGYFLKGVKTIDFCKLCPAAKQEPMRLLKEVKILIEKDLLVEWRQKYALGGILLYVVSTVFVIYIALNTERLLTTLGFNSWNILFWMTILFASVNAIAKSFFQERHQRLVYYYTVVSPQAVILAKMLYNALLMTVLVVLCFLLFSLMIDNPVLHYDVFFGALFLGGMAFSFLFSMMSAIAAKAENNSTLMAILSFPLILPVIMVLIRLSGHAFVQQPNETEVYNHLLILLALNGLFVALSFVLFPYLWRD